MEMRKLWLFIGISFIAGIIWGRVIRDISAYWPLGLGAQHSEHSRMITVDIIQTADDIAIVDHKTGYLIFEYNRFKEVDKETFKEYNDLLIEVLGEK